MKSHDQKNNIIKHSKLSIMIEGKVSRRSRTITRTLKDGGKKQYTTEQVNIPLSSTDPLNDNQTVMILTQEEYNEIQESIKDFESVKDLDPDLINELHGTIEDLRIELEKKSKKIESLQGDVVQSTQRSEKAFALLASTQKVLTDVRGLSFMDRIRNRMPKSYKEIETENNHDLTALNHNNNQKLKLKKSKK